MKNKVEIFKSLADETRLRIINLFIKTDENLCVCELMDALRIPQYTISKALNILKISDLLVTEKKGTWAYYKLNTAISKNNDLFSFLKKYLSSEISAGDESRLKERLLLRENDVCVVGIIPEDDLLKMIKKNQRVKKNKYEASKV